MSSTQGMLVEIDEFMSLCRTIFVLLQSIDRANVKEMDAEIEIDEITKTIHRISPDLLFLLFHVDLPPPYSNNHNGLMPIHDFIDTKIIQGIPSLKRICSRLSPEDYSKIIDHIEEAISTLISANVTKILKLFPQVQYHEEFSIFSIKHYLCVSHNESIFSYIIRCDGDMRVKEWQEGESNQEIPVYVKIYRILQSTKMSSKTKALLEKLLNTLQEK